MLLNFSREAIDVQLPPSPAVAVVIGANKLQDVLTGEPMRTNENQIRLEPFDARVLSSGDSRCASIISAR